jgi:hypothetical protein
VIIIGGSGRPVRMSVFPTENAQHAQIVSGLRLVENADCRPHPWQEHQELDMTLIFLP